MAAPSAQATLTLQDAFERFASSVTLEDKRLFHNTELKDVREEAMRIERQLRARRMQKNMARLDPFLRGMEHYSKVVEVLCNGTPYLAWIWAPVKLMLTIAVDSISAFEKLIEAYGKIADMLPRLDRLNHALAGDHNFQNVLALVYSDIVEFHRRAYKFVRRKSWAIFFSSMWAGFESRFNGILKNLAYHGGLVDKEAAAAEISEAVRRSKADDEKWEQQEREWNAVKIQKVLAWLGTNETIQADILERHMGDYLPGSCEWFVQHKETHIWLGDNAKNSLLWLCGKPGAGKSMICSSLVQHAEANAVHIFYYFCSFLGSHSDGPTRLLRSIISQVIQKHQDLAIYVHDVYFTSHPAPTKKALLGLLPELLQGLGSVRLVIDGVDEWSTRDQKELLKDLAELVSPANPTHNCKIMIASRETMEISRSLRKKNKSVTKVSLSNANESLAVTHAIVNFIDSQLSDLPDHFDELDPDASILVHVKETLRKKSHGMFLWVSLVLKSLDTVYSPEELRTIVDDLPSDLEKLYHQIFIRLCSTPGTRNYGGVPGVMSWICFARRPLHKSELLHALSIFPYNSSSQVQSIPVASILDHCKPLIEELPDSTIVPVHFSVKEYFLKSQTPQIVSAINAALDISSACAIIITRSLSLLQFESNSLEHLAQVASGNYRLLPYAIEFWIEHCSQYASGRGSLGMEQQFQDRLTQMHETHQNCWHALGRTVNQVKARDKTNDRNLDERLRLFSGMKIYQLMADLLHTRLLASKLDGDSSSYIETYFINNDQTLFSQLSQRYESAIVHLLAQHEVEGISPVLLRAFQESYASTAFFCRFPHCDRLSLGFPTAQLRYEHEAVHIQRVYCQTASCQYSRIGFAKRALLNAHTRKHHDQPSIQLIPAKVRNAKSTSTDSEEPSTGIQYYSVPPENFLLERSPEPRQDQQYLLPQSSSQLRGFKEGSLFDSIPKFQDVNTNLQQPDLRQVQQEHHTYQDPEFQSLQEQRKIEINNLTEKLMQTCQREIRQKFEIDVLTWPEDKKKQLLDQGVEPIFYRFQEQARLLLDKRDRGTLAEKVDASILEEWPQYFYRQDRVVPGSSLSSLPDINVVGEEVSPHQEDLEHNRTYFGTILQGESQGFHALQEAEYDQVQESSEKSRPSHLLGERSPDSFDHYLKRRSHQSVDLDGDVAPETNYSYRASSRSNTPLLNFDDTDFFVSSLLDRRIPRSTSVQGGELAHLGNPSSDGPPPPLSNLRQYSFPPSGLESFPDPPLDQSPLPGLDPYSYPPYPPGGSVHGRLPPISEMQNYKSPSATAVSTSTTKGGLTSNRSLESSPSIRLDSLDQENVSKSGSSQVFAADNEGPESHRIGGKRL